MTKSGLLIASGLSSRINGFKPLLKYEGKSFLITIMEKMLAELSHVVIIVGYNHNLIIEELADHFNSLLKNNDSCTWIIDSRITILLNDNYKMGMLTSLQLGVNQLSDSDWILYHFVDQPNLTNEFYSDIFKLNIPSVNWIQPVFEGRKGHPVLFDKKVSSKIISADLCTNLRTILEDDSIKKHYWDCNFPQVIEDIDTDEDYRKLLQKK